MKYEAEINEILNTVLPKESWMTEEEHQEIIEEINKLSIKYKEENEQIIKIGSENKLTENDKKILDSQYNEVIRLLNYLD